MQYHSACQCGTVSYSVYCTPNAKKIEFKQQWFIEGIQQLRVGKKHLKTIQLQGEPFQTQLVCGKCQDTVAVIKGTCESFLRVYPKASNTQVLNRNNEGILQWGM